MPVACRLQGRVQYLHSNELGHTAHQRYACLQQRLRQGRHLPGQTP